MNEYLFDLTLAATVRIRAASVNEARATIKDCIDSNSANLGAWPNGDPIIAEVSLDGEPELVEQGRPA